MWRIFKKTGKFIFVTTYVFLLLFFLWQILLRPSIHEFMPMGPIYTDIAKRIESPDGTKTAILIRSNGWDLNFAVKIKEGLKTRTLHWTRDFVPNLAADWNEKIIWSDDSSFIVLTVEEPPYKRYYTDVFGNKLWCYYEQNEKYIWAYDFRDRKEYYDKDTIISILNSRGKKDEADKDKMLSLEPPKGIDDEWSKWLVGEWQGTAKSDFGGHKDWVKGKCRLNIELDLNGQFIVRKGKAQVISLSDEYIKQLKGQRLSDSNIEKIRNSTFESLEIHTIDPKTGEIIAYLFDSLRCIAKGSGKREGNKEIMNWVWSGQGQGTSVRVTEKVSDNKFITTEQYTMPDGSTMEDRVEMTRKKN